MIVDWLQSRSIAHERTTSLNLKGRGLPRGYLCCPKLDSTIRVGTQPLIPKIT
jgi:hypothetical protein